MVLRSSGRKSVILVENNEFYNVDDPKLHEACKVALSDMQQDGIYIHPDLSANA